MMRFSKEDGLSLIEVMVATVILAIALMGMLTTIVSAMHLERQSNDLNIAKNAAELQLQRLRGMPYDDDPGGLLQMIPEGEVNFTGGFDVHGLRVHPNDADGQCGWFEVMKVSGSDTLLSITVRVEWQGEHRESDAPPEDPMKHAMRFEIASMRSDRGAKYEPEGE